MKFVRIQATLAILLFSVSLQAAEYIELFHSDIEIGRSGDLYVTETIVVKAEGKAIRRGIYRDFPTHYSKPGGGQHVVGFEVLSINRNGVDEPYRVENRSNGKRVYIGDANVFLSPGFYEYRITYLSTRQLAMFDDFDELYWNVTGNGWAFAIEKASALVTLPAEVSEFRLTGYTGSQGSTEQSLRHRQVAANQAYFETTASLGRNEGLTIVAGWPSGLIEKPSDAQQRAWFWHDNKSSIIVAGGAILLLAYYLLIWHRVGRDPEGGIIIPRYQAPAGYSPASMRFIQNMGYDKKCLTAALINLAVKAAVEIRDEDGQFKVFKRESTLTGLAPGEAKILSALFSEGREHVTIAQANHRILSKTVSKHESSLNADYEKKYFSTNSWFLVPGVLATFAVAALALFNIQSEEDLFITIFSSVFTLMPLLMVFAAVKSLRHGGIVGKLRFGVNLIALLAFTAFFWHSEFPFLEYANKIPWWLVGGIISMFLMNYFFYQWLKAPTLAGRRLLDQIEGFKHYLKLAEEDEIALKNAPEFTTDLYEAYLPYAIALDLENEWTARLDRAVASGSVDRNYSQPRWYLAHGHRGTHFSETLSRSFNSAIAASSVAPGSSGSSGSSGGSSGGGGGGGGGGGW